jgi:hypothetical protein
MYGNKHTQVNIREKTTTEADHTRAKEINQNLKENEQIKKMSPYQNIN